MSNNGKDGEDNLSPIKIFGMIIPLIPSLMFRLTGTFLRFKSDANKAGKIFKKELVNQGLDRETAKLFTKEYVEGSNLMKLINNQS